MGKRTRPTGKPPKSKPSQKFKVSARMKQLLTVRKDTAVILKDKIGTLQRSIGEILTIDDAIIQELLGAKADTKPK